MDITQLILDDHHEQRRLFAIIDQIDPKDIASLAAVWKRLSAFLEVHAETEERIFYPELMRVGRKADRNDEVEDETFDAIKDHNEIRDAVVAVAKEKTGTEAWFKAVATANKANSEHMGEEEREGLTEFRKLAPLALRHDLAVSFVSFEVEHVDGVMPVDKDPKKWVAKH
jgi:hypothetical protein